jgi:V/A-type H+-transporting ATPase subunit G/H
MSIEILKQIREQEESAEKTRRDCNLESKRIINEANDKAAALVESAKIESGASYKMTIAKADEEALHHFDKTIQIAKTECDMLSASAEKKLEKAVTIIVGKVVN